MDLTFETAEPNNLTYYYSHNCVLYFGFWLLAIGFCE